MRNTDTLIAVLSDMHSGSSTALCLNRQWQGKHQNHTPTTEQRELYRHFLACAEHARRLRKGKRLILVHDGDAIEGIHHDSRQVITLLKNEQAEIHAELMDDFMRKAGHSRKAGDRLFYINGTETHTDDIENEIAKDLHAEQAREGVHVFDHLELHINGRKIWFVHHGPAAGRGANTGNSMRNWLRDIYWDARRVGSAPPDMVITGHTHVAHYNTFVMDWHTVHGLIVPSWQAKTRYAYKAAPVALNQIGAAFIEIKADGEILAPQVKLMETQSRIQVEV